MVEVTLSSPNDPIVRLDIVEQQRMAVPAQA